MNNEKTIYSEIGDKIRKRRENRVANFQDCKIRL